MSRLTGVSVVSATVALLALTACGATNQNPDLSSNFEERIAWGTSAERTEQVVKPLNEAATKIRSAALAAESNFRDEGGGTLHGPGQDFTCKTRFWTPEPPANSLRMTYIVDVCTDEAGKIDLKASEEVSDGRVQFLVQDGNTNVVVADPALNGVEYPTITAEGWQTCYTKTCDEPAQADTVDDIKEVELAATDYLRIAASRLP